MSQVPPPPATPETAAPPGAAAGLRRAAVYERTVQASLERVLENVLDWEHLPWLHHEAFCAIEPISAGDDGWEAFVALPPREAPSRLRIAVRLDPSRRRYVTRTLEGPGAGIEIWTTLVPRELRRTDVEVGFWLPDALAPAADAIGRGYLALYRTLWDQDEAMMLERQRVLDARAAEATAGDAVALGPASALRREPCVVDAFGGRWRIAWRNGAWLVHATSCPHRGGPLGDAPLDADGCVTCPWHGYRFDVTTGHSADGRRLSLPRPPRLAVDPATDAAELRIDG